MRAQILLSRWLAPALVALGLTVAPPAGAAAAAPRSPADEVRGILAAQEDAWNRGDLEAFMRVYWQSDSLTFYSGGDVSRGWRTAHDRYVRRYRGPGHEMGRLRFELHQVELLDPAHALVKGAWRLTRSAGDTHGLFTLVLRRIPRAGWRIVHDHTSLGS